MKVITFSRIFPKAHPKAGNRTFFVEKIFACLAEKIVGFEIPKEFVNYEWYEYYNTTNLKLHTIRTGRRFKEGDKASLRVWSDKPYRSKQIEFAQVQIVKTYDFSLHVVDNDVLWNLPGIGGGGFGVKSEGLQMIANNDGLSSEDFIAWFACHPKKKANTFEGQIICWADPKY